MKNLILSIIIFTLVITVQSSCKKILEVKPQSNITGEIYFKSEGDFEPYVTGIYSRMRTFANNETYGLERSEELISGSNARFSVAWTQIITPNSGAVNYSSWYAAVGNCNLLLDQIKDFPFSRPLEKSRIIAETYALRANLYFHLTRIIGDAPLMLTAIKNDNVPLLPRSPAVDVIKQINSDLDSAILLFKSNPSFSPVSYPSKYRMSYGAVQAMKADVKLWSAKVLNGGSTDYNAALTAIAEVEATNVKLNANFKDVTGLRASSNSEVILAAYYNRDETGGNFVVNALPFFSIVSGALNIDSLPWCASSANGQGAYQISPLSRSLFSSADKRIPYTWVTERASNGTPKISWITKYPGTKYADDRIADNDLIMYRWATMLLFRAEAYAGLDNTGEAIKALNLVRARSGLPAYSGATDRISIEKELVNENGRELFMENRRWFDLVRFHFGNAVDVYKYIPNLIGKTTPLFWPLDATILSLNPNLKQTAGY